MNKFTPHQFYIPEIDPNQLDKESRLKYEMQKLMPVIELMKIKGRPDSFMGMDRDLRLRLMGFSEAEIEDMTGYKQKAPVPRLDDEETEIFISDKDFPEQLKALKARTDAERKSEINRILNNGFRLGFIEEEAWTEAKL